MAERTACFINLTQHPVNVYADDGTLLRTIPPSGEIARVPVYRQKIGYVNGLRVYQPIQNPPEGLPEPQDGVFYIVSSMVRCAVPHRLDVLSPGQLVRNRTRNVIGCRGFDSNHTDYHMKG